MLGGLRVVLPGSATITRFQTERAGALLAFLVYHRERDHSRDRLAEMLWPDADRDAGRQRLRVALHSLRRLLEPPETMTAIAGVGGDLIVSTRQTLGINPLAPISTDVEALHEHLNALRAPAQVTEIEFHMRAIDQLYVDVLLPNLYDDWVLTERERLAQRVAQARRFAAERSPSVHQKTPPTSVNPPSSVSSDTAAARRRLPAALTRFWGRETEIGLLLPQLAPNATTRLITLIGPGGVGKTRLAIAAAEQAAGGYGPDNVLFVPLHDVSDAEQIADEIARRLHHAPHPGKTAREVIATALGGNPALIVLDNLEHLLSDESGDAPATAARLIGDLLVTLPAATFLVTSRHRLRLEVEQVFPVSPLPVPSANLSLVDLRKNDCVLLFTDRARQARPDFAVTGHSAAAVASLCARLEGIPLALELAAAWASLLTPAQMLDRLGTAAPEGDKAFPVSRHQDRASRHRTLDTALRWSVERLPEPLLLFWTRLSVFRGGWTAEAAEAVCGGLAGDASESQESALLMLAALQDRSLILSGTDDPKTVRFRMLEALREYGNRLMLESDAALARLRDRHLAYFTRLAENEAEHLPGTGSVESLQVLDADYPNLIAALEWSRQSGTSENAAMALRLAVSLSDYWLIRGRLTEGRRYLQEALTHLESGFPPELLPQNRLADAWQGMGSLAQAAGDLARARVCYETAMQFALGSDDPRRIAAQHNNLGLIAELEGRVAEATERHLTSLALRREIGDQRGEASSLNNLGVLKQFQQDYVAARDYYRQSLEIKRQMGEKRPLASAYNNLGNASHALGDYGEAEYYQRHALALRRELGDQAGIAASLNNLGRIAESRATPPRQSPYTGRGWR